MIALRSGVNGIVSKDQPNLVVNEVLCPVSDLGGVKFGHAADILEVLQGHPHRGEYPHPGHRPQPRGEVGIVWEGGVLDSLEDDTSPKADLFRGTCIPHIRNLKITNGSLFTRHPYGCFS